MRGHGASVHLCGHDFFGEFHDGFQIGDGGGETSGGESGGDEPLFPIFISPDFEVRGDFFEICAMDWQVKRVYVAKRIQAEKLLIDEGGISMRTIKAIRMFLLAAFMVVAMAGTAFAGSQDFELENGTGRTIAYIYLSPSNENAWIYQDELGPNDVLRPGESIFITFSPRDRVRYWDIKVVYDNNKEDVWEDLDLYRIFNITIRPGGTVSIEST